MDAHCRVAMESNVSARVTRLTGLLNAVQSQPPQRVAVAAAHDPTVLASLQQAQARKIVSHPMLFGRADELERMCGEVGLEVRSGDIVDAPEDAQAAVLAAQAVSRGDAEVLMKGKVHTDDFLRGLLNKEAGLRTGRLLSHCFVLEHPREERLMIVTDAGMNIAPTLSQKAAIALNAIYLAELLGIESPRVAALAAVELVNEAMPATIDAAALATMSDRRQFSRGIIDGPFGMDNATSIEAAHTKGIGGPVAGMADVLLVPDIEAGNILVKTFSFLCGGSVAGVIVGAAAPVVLTSRADSASSKLYSIALAVLMANMQRNRRLKIGRMHQ